MFIAPIRHGSLPLIAAAAVFSLAATPASAALIALTGVEGNNELEATYETASTSSGLVQSGPLDTYALAVPGQYSFDGTLDEDQTGLATLGAGVGDYSFVHSYVFSIDSAADGGTLVTSLNFPASSSAPYYQISNLQMRLYQVTGPVPLPVTGDIQPFALGGSVAVVSDWQGATNLPYGALVWASFSDIVAGQYVLDIAGIANGAWGGTYTGQLDLAPVPLPAAFWLLASGLGALGTVASRRRKRAA